MCCIPHTDWSLLLLVNIQGSYTVNKVAYKKHYLQLPVVYETESTTFCQYMEKINTHPLLQKQG